MHNRAGARPPDFFVAELAKRSPPALTFFIVLALATLRLDADELLPKPARWVFDAAGVLAAGDTERLEAKLQRLRESGAAEMIVYIATSLPEHAVMEDLTLRSVNAWGLGDAATDNGIALFAFMKDRKLRIEVGRGLEARISDAAAKAILDEHITPAFRAGKHAEGLAAAIDAIELQLQQPSAPAGQTVTTRLGATLRIHGPANAPRVTRRAFPRYPEEARKAGTEGTVHLEVLIDAAGHVADVTVTRGLPHGLSESAKAAVRQWQFAPVPGADGKPVPALVDVVMMFRL